jgi:hypothetical protein
MFYYAAKDDRLDHYRRLNSGELERREHSVDPAHMIWYPVAPGFLERWGIELTVLPCINDSGLRLLT